MLAQPGEWQKVCTNVINAIISWQFKFARLNNALTRLAFVMLAEANVLTLEQIIGEPV